MDTLPKFVVGHIASYLKIADKARFARTCKKYQIYMPEKEILKILYARERELAQLFHRLCSPAICRLCHDSSTDLSECANCHLPDICDGCLSEYEVCLICRWDIKCFSCPKEADARCYLCGHYICKLHQTQPHAEIYYCSSCTL